MGNPVHHSPAISPTKKRFGIVVCHAHVDWDQDGAGVHGNTPRLWFGLWICGVGLSLLVHRVNSMPRCVDKQSAEPYRHCSTLPAAPSLQHCPNPCSLHMRFALYETEQWDTPHHEDCSALVVWVCFKRIKTCWDGTAFYEVTLSATRIRRRPEAYKDSTEMRDVAFSKNKHCRALQAVWIVQCPARTAIHRARVALSSARTVLNPVRTALYSECFALQAAWLVQCPARTAPQPLCVSVAPPRDKPTARCKTGFADGNWPSRHRRQPDSHRMYSDAWSRRHDHATASVITRGEGRDQWPLWYVCLKDNVPATKFNFFWHDTSTKQDFAEPVNNWELQKEEGTDGSQIGTEGP